MANSLGVKRTTLYLWINEEATLPGNIYLRIDPKREFYSFVIDERENSWGQRVGGKNSSGTTKVIKLPSKSVALAELCGIIIGDGNIFISTRKKVYTLRIAGHSVEDYNYLITHVSPLITKLFKISTRIYSSKRALCCYVIADSVRLCEFLNSLEIKDGNKKKNNQHIPSWIKADKQLSSAFIRGLIDTDGSIHRMSKKDPNLLRISFKSHIPNLLQETYLVLTALGYSPVISHSSHQIVLSRQSEIKKYVNEIGFSNEKHIKRYQLFNTRSPVV